MRREYTCHVPRPFGKSCANCCGSLSSLDNVCGLSVAERRWLSEVIAHPDRNRLSANKRGNGRGSLCDGDEEAQPFQRAIFLFNTVASSRGTVAV
jgi:hypothetical protein